MDIAFFTKKTQNYILPNMIILQTEAQNFLECSVLLQRHVMELWWMIVDWAIFGTCTSVISFQRNTINDNLPSIWWNLIAFRPHIYADLTYVEKILCPVQWIHKLAQNIFKTFPDVHAEELGTFLVHAIIRSKNYTLNSWKFLKHCVLSQRIKAMKMPDGILCVFAI